MDSQNNNAIVVNLIGLFNEAATPPNAMLTPTQNNTVASNNLAAPNIIVNITNVVDTSASSINLSAEFNLD